jgi:fucose 4-O-acetylase-like acetyltransferase
MTYREISAWISAVLTLLVYGWYIVHAPARPEESLGLYISLVVTLAVGLAILHGIAAALHDPEKADERDRLIASRATRNSAYVLMTGVMTATFHLMSQGKIFAFLGPFSLTALAVHILVLTAIAGEVTRDLSEIFYYRRGG